MATHLCSLAWKVPWAEEHGGLHSSWGCKELAAPEPARTQAKYSMEVESRAGVSGGYRRGKPFPLGGGRKATFVGKRKVSPAETGSETTRS